MPARQRQAKQGLQRAVDMAGTKQISPARHQRYPVGRIIQRDGKVIAGRQILAHQHHITKVRQVDRDRPGQIILPHQRARIGQCPLRIEPPCHGTRGAGRGVLAGAGVDQTIATRTCAGCLDFCSGAAARIQQAARFQHFGGGGVRLQPGRLRGHLVPFQPQPIEIAAEFIRQFGAGARPVNILDPEQKSPAARLGQIMGDDRR